MESVDNWLGNFCIIYGDRYHWAGLEWHKHYAPGTHVPSPPPLVHFSPDLRESHGSSLAWLGVSEPLHRPAIRPLAPKVFDPRYTAIALCAFGLNDFKPNWVSVRLQSSISEKPYNKVVYSFSLHHSRIVPRSPSNKWELKIPKSQNFFW